MATTSTIRREIRPHTASAVEVRPLDDWCPHPSIHPRAVTGGRGGRLIDDRGREWVDFHSAWGASILGYRNPAVTSAIREQLEVGVNWGLDHDLGTEVADLLSTLVPGAENVAFAKNGSDVTMAAVRLARAVTGRERVLMRGYHGFHDWSLASDRGCRGIPSALRDHIDPLPFNDIHALEGALYRHRGSTAAIILDLAPPPLPRPGFLTEMVDLAHSHGALVIFDEVATGLRLAPGGAQEHCGVTADLACFSKALANGLPLAALTGPVRLMRHLREIRFDMTFAREALSLAAARATLEVIRDSEVCAGLWSKGIRLQRSFAEVARRHEVRADLAGFGPRCQLDMADQNGIPERELRWLVLQELARDGIFSTGVFLVCHAHDEDDLVTAEKAFDRALSVAARAIRAGSCRALLDTELLAALTTPGQSDLLRPVEYQFQDRPRTRPKDGLRGAVLRVLPAGIVSSGRALVEKLTKTNTGVDQLPEDFDWRAYLERYPDLGAAGISDELAAVRHWLDHGCHEDRWATRASLPEKKAMSCRSAHSMFLRAWGDLACWDDAGSCVTLQPWDRAVDYGSDVYLGPVFNRIREQLHRNEMPFPERCRRCICLETETRTTSYHLDQRVVELFEVEPSILCPLDCTGCLPRRDRRRAPRPHCLPPDRFAKVLSDLAAAGVRVLAFSFQGHGEPLVHPELPALATLSKKAFPASYLAVATSAHVRRRDDLFDCGIDELVCAVDGVDQASYAPYRVNGDFVLAFDLMRDAARRRQLRVVWRYTIFNHNDRPEQLLAAQRLAAEIGVDELVFVLTSNGPKSMRVTSPAQIPDLGGTVPMSFRTVWPDAADLARRLSAARSALERHDRDHSLSLLASVAETIGRFVTDRGGLWPVYEPIIDDLVALAAEIDDEERAALLDSVAHLI